MLLLSLEHTGTGYLNLEENQFSKSLATSEFTFTNICGLRKCDQ